MDNKSTDLEVKEPAPQAVPVSGLEEVDITFTIAVKNTDGDWLHSGQGFKFESSPEAGSVYMRVMDQVGKLMLSGMEQSGRFADGA